MKRTFFIPITILCIGFMSGCALMNSFFFPSDLRGGAGSSSSSGGSPVGVIPGIYVSLSGNDSNTGNDPSAPVVSVQKGVDQATLLGYANVLVASGTYVPGTGLNTPAVGNNYSGVLITNSNLNLLGGWNNGFTAVTGRSTLDGQTTISHIIYLSKAKNVRLDGLNIINGGATTVSSNGGGIFIGAGSTGNHITNCLISNNTAANSGGGVFIATNTYTNDISCEIVFNSASNGGGICACGNTISLNSHVYSNWATHIGGGVSLINATNCTLSGTMMRNTSLDSGGGFSEDNCYNISIDCLISENSVIGGWRTGGGLVFTGGSKMTISGNTIISSNYGYTVSAIHIQAENTYLSARIFENESESSTIYITADDCTVSNSTISGNRLLSEYVGMGSAMTLSPSINNFKAMDCVISNNLHQSPATNYIIFVVYWTGDRSTNIQFIRNKIAAVNNDFGCAFLDEDSVLSYPGFSFISNIFYTNTMKRIYEYSYNGRSITNASWQDMNSYQTNYGFTNSFGNTVLP